MECILVAFSRNFGIGKNNKIPWSIPEDLYNFKRTTDGHTVVMGRKTFESIGVPLKNRFNLVHTSNPDNFEHVEGFHDNISFVKNLTGSVSLMRENVNNIIFYIGGNSVYKFGFENKVPYIYATIIEKDFECDTFFPYEYLKDYDIIKISNKQYSEKEKCFFHFVMYKRKCESNTISNEKVYLSLLEKVLREGEERTDRTKVGTRAIFGEQMKFDISRTVPFLTTKQLAWKTVTKELLWFLKGDTNSKNLEKNGVNIWKGNTSREFLDNRGLTDYIEGDMGPLYSHALRAFGSDYKGCEHNHIGEGYDQLNELVKGLKEEPMSRRHVLTTYNPGVVDKCVLMPCHGIAIQFHCHMDDGLSCHVYCRSSDCFLGLPFNIASYSILTYIIAKKVGRVPKHLIVSTGDTHIYKNHVDQVNEQLTRHILPSPILHISDRIKDVPFEDITMNDIELHGYIYQPAIKAAMAV
jgi:thymidylate synthase